MSGFRGSRSGEGERLTLGSELLDEAFSHVEGRRAFSTFAGLTADDCRGLGFEAAACRAVSAQLHWGSTPAHQVAVSTLAPARAPARGARALLAPCARAPDSSERLICVRRAASRMRSRQDPWRPAPSVAITADLAGTTLMHQPEFLWAMGNQSLLRGQAQTSGSGAYSSRARSEDCSALDLLLSVGERLDASCAHERVFPEKGHSMEFDAAGSSASAARGRGSRGGGRGGSGRGRGRGSRGGRGGGGSRGGRGGRGAAGADQLHPCGKSDSQPQELLDLLEEGLKAGDGFSTELALSAQGPLAPSRGEQEQSTAVNENTAGGGSRPSAESGSRDLSAHAIVQTYRAEERGGESQPRDASGRTQTQGAAEVQDVENEGKSSRGETAKEVGAGMAVVCASRAAEQLHLHRKPGVEKGHKGKQDAAGMDQGEVGGGGKAQAGRESGAAKLKRACPVEKAGDVKRGVPCKEGTGETGKREGERSDQEEKAMRKSAEDAAEEGVCVCVCVCVCVFVCVCKAKQ